MTVYSRSCSYIRRRICWSGRKRLPLYWTHDENSKVVVRFKTKHMLIRSEEPVAWTRDGENGGEHTQVELTNLQQVLEIMTEAGDEPVVHEMPLA
ncbi:MAG: hypothetical protein ACLTSZ_10370 [Lachnospiraceae bacterium]